MKFCMTRPFYKVLARGRSTDFCRLDFCRSDFCGATFADFDICRLDLCRSDVCRFGPMPILDFCRSRTFADPRHLPKMLNWRTFADLRHLRIQDICRSDICRSETFAYPRHLLIRKTYLFSAYDVYYAVTKMMVKEYGNVPLLVLIAHKTVFLCQKIKN